MPITLTVNNIPVAVYERLREAADQNRRSLESEAIFCLTSALLPSRMAPAERLARARELRAMFPGREFLPIGIDKAKRTDRQ